MSISSRTGKRPSEDVTLRLAVKVPPNDADAIGLALAKLMGDDELRASLGTAARTRLEELYTQRSVANRYRQLYIRYATGAS
ncbi:MAG: hypothetical protein O6944_08160 [Gammaproteobacteria bacterium]|nr:hypothetical protein [Gammaproteobacteria bacterium]